MLKNKKYTKKYQSAGPTDYQPYIDLYGNERPIITDTIPQYPAWKASVEKDVKTYPDNQDFQRIYDENGNIKGVKIGIEDQKRQNLLDSLDMVKYKTPENLLKAQKEALIKEAQRYKKEGVYNPYPRNYPKPIFKNGGKVKKYQFAGEAGSLLYLTDPKKIAEYNKKQVEKPDLYNTNSKVDNTSYNNYKPTNQTKVTQTPITFAGKQPVFVNNKGMNTEAAIKPAEPKTLYNTYFNTPSNEHGTGLIPTLATGIGAADAIGVGMLTKGLIKQGVSKLSKLIPKSNINYRIPTQLRNIDNLPPKPFTIDSEFPAPIQNIEEVPYLSSQEIERFRDVVTNNPNYLRDNNIAFTPERLSTFINRGNVNINTNTIRSLINNTTLANNVELIPYRDLTLRQLKSKNPSLFTQLSQKLNKMVKETDKKLGEMVFSGKKIDEAALTNKANEELSKGVGIKKSSIPVKVKPRHLGGLNYDVLVDPDKTGNFVKSGQISFEPKGLKPETFSQGVQEFLNTLINDLFKNRPKGIVKNYDFPTSDIDINSYPNFNPQGIGAEVGEAFKRGVKSQDNSFELLSSKSHTGSGALRYLTEYLNGRKIPVDVSDNPGWLKAAESLKKQLNGRPISKSEVKQLMDNDFKLIPHNIRFKYTLPPLGVGIGIAAQQQLQNNQQVRKYGGKIKYKQYNKQ